jgi:putative endonuclease
MNDSNRTTGNRGEALAAEWYRQRGYEVLGTNVRVGRNELDLICRTGQETVFVEVKTVTDDEFGDPVYKVDRQKRRAVVMATRLWLLGHPQGDRGVRFDIMTVDGSTRPPAMDHRPAAFTADDT